MLEELFRLVELREQLFFFLELRGMNAAARSAELDRMLEVKHLVVNDVFDDIAGHANVIEDAADDDGVVRGIVMSEHIARTGLAPGHLRAGEESEEEARVEFVEKLVEVIDVADGAFHTFASAHLA